MEYMFSQNTDFSRRDEIIFGRPAKYKVGGIERFEAMGVDTLRTLFEEKFIDPETQWNGSPKEGEFLEFLEKHPSFTVHGYVVSPDRSDCRVTVEGVYKGSDPTYEELVDLVKYFRLADEFDLSVGWVWYD